jgi:hypothetical protein
MRTLDILNPNDYLEIETRFYNYIKAFEMYNRFNLFRKYIKLVRSYFVNFTLLGNYSKEFIFNRFILSGKYNGFFRNIMVRSTFFNFFLASIYRHNKYVPSIFFNNQSLEYFYIYEKLSLRECYRTIDKVINYFHKIDSIFFNDRGPDWLLHKNSSTMFIDKVEHGKQDEDVKIVDFEKRLISSDFSGDELYIFWIFLLFFVMLPLYGLLVYDRSLTPIVNYSITLADFIVQTISMNLNILYTSDIAISILSPSAYFFSYEYDKRNYFSQYNTLYEVFC